MQHKAKRSDVPIIVDGLHDELALAWEEDRFSITTPGFNGEAGALFVTLGKLQTWLGANDIDVEGSFADEDGIALTWQQWSSTPATDDQDCLTLLWDGRWNDRGCEQTLAYICEL